MNQKLRNVPFSPPDMTEAEAKEVREAILSGWITTGPRTKKLEKLIGILKLISFNPNSLAHLSQRFISFFTPFITCVNLNVTSFFPQF